MSYKPFTSAEESFAHSREIRDMLYEHDDFMASVGTLADMGCGEGRDLEWWATRTTRDDTPIPLNIKCTGIDILPELSVAHRYPNIQYQQQDFEKPIMQSNRKFDIIWSHDSLQYAINPMQTLLQWREAINDNGMLILSVPQTTNLEFNVQEYNQHDYCYYNWTIVSLIHMLAITGWDCAGGHFLKNLDDPWINAIVYKSNQEPLDPRTTRWYTLAEQGLLPESAVKSVYKRGFLRQADLVLPWLDGSLAHLGRQ